MVSLRAMLRQNRDTKQRQEISEAEARVQEAQLATDGIQQEVAKLRASSAAFGAKYDQALSNRDEIDRLQRNVQAIDDRVNFLRLDAPSPGFVQMQSFAETPDIAIKGGRRKIFALFLVAALMLAVAVPTGLDLIDPKVKTADELDAILGFAPLGVIDHGSDRHARESLRRVALAIIREWRASGVRSFVLAPVSGRAGTTALTLALARELSRLGRRTVAIEANQMAPDPRYAPHGIHNGIVDRQANGGLNAKATSGLNGGAWIKPKTHSIIAANDLLPQRIPICRHFGGPCRTLECIESLVALALVTNDIVLIDAPALLSSADAEMLIQMPAAAILVVRKDRDLLPEVMAAAHALEKISPAVVGAILNAIAIDDGASPIELVTTPVAIGGDSVTAVEESYQA
jgi:polysaccharide biosynthesis transport protein